ncbi:Arf-GAP with SH3 domain [Mactra antiquata]
MKPKRSSTKKMTEKTPNVTIEITKPKAHIGLLGAVAFGIGTMIGSGIFISATGALRFSGSVGVSLIIWALCGIMTLVTGLVYAELGTFIPQSGGDFNYIKHGLGEFPAFLAVWIIPLFSDTAAMAVMAIAFSKYLLAWISGGCVLPLYVNKLLSTLMMISICVSNACSVNFSRNIQIVCTTGKMFVLLVISVAGIVFHFDGSSILPTDCFSGTHDDVSSYCLAVYSCMFAYGGFTRIGDIADEIINPRKTIPKAVIISVSTVTVIYVIANVSFVSVLTKEEILTSDAVVFDWSMKKLKPAVPLIQIGVLLSIYGTCNGDTFGSSRVMFAAARAGHYPEVISFLNIETSVPELDTDRSELTKLKKSVRALYNSTNNSALHEFSKVTKTLGMLIEDMSKSLHNTLQFPLESFLKGDIKGVKGDLRKPFDKAWKDYESKFSKLEKDAKKKANDQGFYKSELSGSEVAEEMEKERKIFQLQLCMYLIKVNEIKTKKGVDLLSYLIEYYKSVKLFFNKGQSAIEKHHEFVETLGQQLKDIKQSQLNERSKLQELQTSLKNSMAGYKEPTHPSVSPPGYSLHQLQGNKNHGSYKEGYLLKKSEGMLKKVWQKRKCCIKDGSMSISHSDETKDPVKLNLLTCQVKLVSDDPGKKCFDLVSSHGNRTYHFQADDEKEMEKWISVLSNAKEDVLLQAFQDSASSERMNEEMKELTRSIIDSIEKLPGNKVCCDCGAPDPKWLSTNLGVLICLECCGIHRNLGVHVSRTQSLEIDQLGTSQLLLARVIGNDNFNEVLEARLTDLDLKPKPDSPMKEREEFIKAKYLQHKFTIQTNGDTSELQQDLYIAIQTRDIQAVIQVYAEGLDLMTVFPDSPSEETALHFAIKQEDDSSLHIVDFIVQNSSQNSLSRQTKDGDTCLHLCAKLNKLECMKCLLRIKPDIAHIKNKDALTAFDIAKQNNFQFCAELLKAAMNGKKDVFEHINIEWDLMMDEGLDYQSDDDIDIVDPRKPRSRPTSLIGVEMPHLSPRDRAESDANHRPIKPKIPGLTNSSQSLPTSSPLANFNQGQRSPEPPVPPRGIKKPPPLLPPGGESTGTNQGQGQKNTHDTEISYILHRRTPSEPPPRPAPLDSSRYTVSIPYGDVRHGGSQSALDTSEDKPAVPPRPRALSGGTEVPETPPPVPAPRKPKKIGFRRCEALFDCDADNEDELTFREGEVIVLLREEEEEWWEGEIEKEPHRKGLFPISFVKPLPD